MVFSRRSTAAAVCAGALSVVAFAGCSSSSSDSEDTVPPTSDEQPATTAGAGVGAGETPAQAPVEEIASLKFVLEPGAADDLPDTAAALTYVPRAEPAADEVAVLADEFGVSSDLGELKALGSETGWVLTGDGGESVTIYDDARLAWVFSSGVDSQTAQGVAVSDDDAVGVAEALWEQLGVDASQFDVEVIASDNQRQVLGWLPGEGGRRDVVWSVQVDPDMTVSAAAGQLVVPVAGEPQSLDDPEVVLSVLEEQSNVELLAQARAAAGVAEGEELDWPAATPAVVIVTAVEVRFVADADDATTRKPFYEFMTRDPLVSYLHPAVLDS